MGNRANIKLVYAPDANVYLYSHWDGAELENVLQAALRRGKGRWDDPPYLARIIFSEMIKDSLMDDTGYGISPYGGDSDHPGIVVDLIQQTVVRRRQPPVSFKEFVLDSKSPEQD